MGTISTVTPVMDAHVDKTPAPVPQASIASRSLALAAMLGDVETKTAPTTVDATVEITEEGNICITFPQTVDFATLRETKAGKDGVPNSMFFTVAVPPLEVNIVAGDREKVKYTKPGALNFFIKL